MAVSAVIQIEQWAPESEASTVRDAVLWNSGQGVVRDTVPSLSGWVWMKAPPNVSNPACRPSITGLKTDNSEQWSDSPTNSPTTLYRHRFAWGRDCQDGFPTKCGIALAPGSAGQQWGNLDFNSGQVIYTRLYPLSNDGTVVREFRVRNVGHLKTIVMGLSSTGPFIKQLGTVSADTTVEQFPFLLLAAPEPHSKKNPVDTDIYIRLSHFSFPLDADSVVLYIDGELADALTIEEFFGGLGGFDVTWVNDQLFEYDARVTVRWEFSDTAIPAHHLVIEYPFYTVPDLLKPRVLNLSPQSGAASVSIDGFVQFDVVDYETGVDINSLRLFINGVLAEDGENGELTITPYENGLGYTVKFQPNLSWLYGDLIPVAIFVRDASIHENELFYSYSFTTEESAPPRLLNPSPAPCMVGVQVGTDVLVDVISGSQGLSRESILLVVNNQSAETAAFFPLVHRDS